MWLQMLHSTLPSLKPFLQHCNQNTEARALGALWESLGPLGLAALGHFRPVLGWLLSVQFVPDWYPPPHRPSPGVLNAPCMEQELGVSYLVAEGQIPIEKLLNWLSEKVGR